MNTTKELIIPSFENFEGGVTAVALRAWVTKETGLLAVQGYESDAFEITQEQALRLAAYIICNCEKIASRSEF